MPRREAQHSLWHPTYEREGLAEVEPALVLNERMSKDEVSLVVEPQESV